MEQNAAKNKHWFDTVTEQKNDESMFLIQHYHNLQLHSCSQIIINLNFLFHDQYLCKLKNINDPNDEHAYF